MTKLSTVEQSGFAERIKELRTKKDLSASAFAKLAKVTPASVWQWENNGTSPRADTLTTIAETFGVTENYLLHGRRKGDRLGKVIAASATQSSAFKEASLEDMIRAIEAKGFIVSIRSKE
jgi:transcriptional regulator with XRE-family HTH domain